MSNKLTIGERPNKKNIESLNLTRKVNLLRLWRGKYYTDNNKLLCFMTEIRTIFQIYAILKNKIFNKIKSKTLG